MNFVANMLTTARQEAKELGLTPMCLGILPGALPNDLHDHPFLVACALCV